MKRIKVRFNLGKGKNFMKWKIQFPNGKVEYYTPNEVQLVMSNCQLRNHTKTAQKIFEGGEKVVCAWVLCESIEILTKDFKSYDTTSKRVKYNPRVQPNWLLDDEIVDKHYFNKIGSVDYGLYIENN
jgi:hypothetical protein